MPGPIIRRTQQFGAVPSRREGIGERRLLTAADSSHQNVVLVDAAQGAEVELHRVANSESLFVLEGELEIFGDDFRERLGPGDLCHFRPETAHGVAVLGGAARFLVIFAPSLPLP